MTNIIDSLHQDHANLAKLLDALERQLALFDEGETPDYDIVRGCVVLNAAAALMVAGITEDASDAADRAREAIDSRAATAKLAEVVEATQRAARAPAGGGA